MSSRANWLGLALGLAFVALGATGTSAPLHAAEPVGGATAIGGTSTAHAFSFEPIGVTSAPARHAKDANAYLALVSGTGDAPMAAAVRERGKLRIVRKGDKLDGAVIASITPDTLLLRGLKTGAPLITLARSR